jgi:hypothetical protein
MVLTAAHFFAFIGLILILNVVSLAQKVGKKQSTQASTAQQAAANQDAGEPVIVTAATHFFAFTAFILIRFLAPLAEEMSKK